MAKKRRFGIQAEERERTETERWDPAGNENGMAKGHRPRRGHVIKRSPV